MIKYTYTLLFIAITLFVNTAIGDHISCAQPLDRFAMLKQWRTIRKLINVDGLNLTGKGVKVGIIDDKVDFDHPIFKSRRGGKNVDCDPASEGCRYPTHGTYVAGALSEIAPFADLVSYNVADEYGNIRVQSINDALKLAIDEDVQVINMSLGTDQLHVHTREMQNIIDEAHSRNIVIVTAAGNLGSDHIPLYPAVWSDVITVGASTLPKEAPEYAVVGTDTRKILLNPKTRSFFSLRGTYPMEYVRMPQIGSNVDYDVSGKVVVLEPGDKRRFAIHNHFFTLYKKGALASLLVTQDTDPFRYPIKSNVLDILPHGYATISPRNGSYLKRCISAGKKDITLFSNEQEMMTEFSSEGPTNNIIKPDLVAPGESIISLSGDQGFEAGSGTSVAAPMVTGAGALLKEAHPDWSADQIVSAICNHAVPLKGDIGKKTYLPHVQGSGRLDVGAAIKSETSIYPHSITFHGDYLDQMIERELTLENRGCVKKTYVLRTDTKRKEKVSIQYPESVALGPGESTKVKLKVSHDLDSIKDQNQFAGRLYVACGEEKLNVPFQIVIG